MNQNAHYNFTDEDMMSPIYCMKCHTHVPRLVSSAGKGICPRCIQEIQHAIYLKEQERLQKEAQKKQQQLAKKQAIYYKDTGKGKCPQCASTNIFQLENHQGGDVGLKSSACCLGCLCAWPLLLAIPFVGNSRKVGTSRQCRSCGYRWAV
jgi:hypothetical protein